MSPIDLAWLSGLLEGEGCFTRHSVTASGLDYPQLFVHMTDRDVVERAARLMGVSVVNQAPARPELSRKALYKAALRGRPAVDMMKQLLPHMGERRSARIRELIENFERH